MHEYNQQRRTFRGAVCEERVEAAAGAGVSRQARGVILSTRQLLKSKEESVSGAEWRRAKRAGVQRKRTVSTDHHFSKRIGMICIVPAYILVKKNPDIIPIFPCSWYIPPFFEIYVERFVLILPYFLRKNGTSEKTYLIFAHERDTPKNCSFWILHYEHRVNFREETLSF